MCQNGIFFERADENALRGNPDMLRVWVEEIKRKIEIYNYESVSLAKDEKWCDEGWKSRNYRDRKYLNK